MTLNTELLFGKNPAAGGYQIERSIRLNAPDSAHLSRTPSVAGNRKTWTWAGWVKRGTLGGNQVLFGSPVAQNYTLIWFVSDNLSVENYNAGVATTSAVFRDTSAWYHIVVVANTTTSTTADRLIIYVNGIRQTTGTYSAPSQNLDLYLNQASEHRIGRFGFNGFDNWFNGYLADIHFIDGQALDPTSFGGFDANGVWQPKAYTGTYPGNSFHLPFSDNSTAAALGTETSGAGNNWTVNNISVAAGAGNDSLVDTPTNYGTDTGAGGEVRGNYCTLNPLSGNPSITLRNGNLERSGAANNKMGTIGMSSGKWYWEVVCNTLTGNAFNGITEYQYEPNDYALNYTYTASNGNKWVGYTQSSYGASYAVGDVIGFAYNADSGSLTCYKNGVSQGVLVSGLSGKTLFPLVRSDGTAEIVCNFGQRPFAYPAPSGFKALCTTNLPEPTIADGSTAMDVKLYTGNGSTQTISGLGFSPDLVWIKARGIGYWHRLIDSVRGAQKFLYSNDASAEGTSTANDIFTSFDSTGFTLGGANPSADGLNQNTLPYVAWTWDAGSSTVTNTDGSITSQVRANPSAGFSIVTYTGNTTDNATVGHGLGVAPAMIIVKNRDAVLAWGIWHSSLSSTQVLRFDTQAAAVPGTAYFRPGNNTSSVFSLGTNDETNQSPYNYVAYCFAPVAGYSAFGSYTGNGSADGPFVYTGFRPRWLIVKASSSTGDWYMIDSSRDLFNLSGKSLQANTSISEPSTGGAFSATLDLLSNGFKFRDAGSGSNGSGVTYVWAAFAEHPFQTARAR